MRLTLTLRFLKRAVAAWWNDNAIRLGASLSYYTLFALAPMLLVAIAIAGSAFGEEAVRGEIVGQVNGLIGNEGGVAVQALLKGAALRGDSTLATIIGSITFFFAACGAFLELQSAFNTIWRVTPSPSNGGQHQGVRTRSHPVLRPRRRDWIPVDGVARGERRAGRVRQLARNGGRQACRSCSTCSTPSCRSR